MAESAGLAEIQLKLSARAVGKLSAARARD